MPKQGQAKRDGVINQHNYNLQPIFNTKNFDTLTKASNQLESTAELDYVCPRGLSGTPAVTFTK